MDTGNGPWKEPLTTGISSTLSSSDAVIPTSVVRRAINTLATRHWLMVIDPWWFGTRHDRCPNGRAMIIVVTHHPVCTERTDAPDDSSSRAAGHHVPVAMQSAIVRNYSAISTKSSCFGR